MPPTVIPACHPFGRHQRDGTHRGHVQALEARGPQAQHQLAVLTARKFRIEPSDVVQRRAPHEQIRADQTDRPGRWYFEGLVAVIDGGDRRPEVASQPRRRRGGPLRQDGTTQIGDLPTLLEDREAVRQPFRRNPYIVVGEGKYRRATRRNAGIASERHALSSLEYVTNPTGVKAFVLASECRGSVGRVV